MKLMIFDSLVSYGKCIWLFPVIWILGVLGEHEDCSLPEASSSARVVGGKRARIGDHPSIVSIHNLLSIHAYKFICAGSIIAEDIILTAAHCADMSPETLEIHPNYDNTVEAKPGDKVYGVTRIAIHSGFDSDYNVDDIALLWLNESIRFTEYIKPARLAYRRWNTSDHVVRNLEVAGWGYTESSYMAAYCLRSTTLEYQDESVCSGHYVDWAPGDICAGSHGNDTCEGDSGGPLLIKGNAPGKPDLLVGITSFGSARCGRHSAGYVNLIKYMDWIKCLVGNDKKLDIDNGP